MTEGILQLPTLIHPYATSNTHFTVTVFTVIVELFLPIMFDLY